MLSYKRGHPARDTDGIVVSVNGVQIPITGIDPNQTRTYDERKSMLKVIGARVEADYKNALRNDPALQAYSTAAMDAVRHRLIPSQAN